MANDETPYPERVAWLSHSFGYDGDFMYLAPILSEYCRRFPATRIIVEPKMLTKNEAGLPLAPWLHTKTLTLRRPSAAGDYGRVLDLPSPGFFFHLLRFRPQLLIFYDFSRVTWLGALAAAVMGRRCRVLLLIEGDPAYRGARHGRLQRAIRRLIARRASVVMTNNQPGAIYARDTLGVAADRLLIRPYLTSVPLPATRDADEGTDDRLHFLFLNSITPRKGLACLIRAVAALDAAHRQRLRVRVVGDGAERAACERLSVELGVAEAFSFAGAVPWREVRRAYADADVFVNPSLRDYRSLAGFEAIACGLPVIASVHDGAAAEVVESGNGFIVDPRDTGAFAAALAFFVDRRHEVERMAAASRAMASRYTVGRVVANLVEASRLALSRRPD
ncbi:MAG: glycosyltransferase [Rhodospirillales bacterium]